MQASNTCSVYSVSTVNSTDSQMLETAAGLLITYYDFTIIIHYV